MYPPVWPGPGRRHWTSTEATNGDPGATSVARRSRPGRGGGRDGRGRVVRGGSGKSLTTPSGWRLVSEGGQRDGPGDGGLPEEGGDVREPATYSGRARPHAGDGQHRRPVPRGPRHGELTSDDGSTTAGSGTNISHPRWGSTSSTGRSSPSRVHGGVRDDVARSGTPAKRHAVRHSRSGQMESAYPIAAPPGATGGRARRPTSVLRSPGSATPSSSRLPLHQ